MPAAVAPVRYVLAGCSLSAAILVLLYIFQHFSTENNISSGAKYLLKGQRPLRHAVFCTPFCTFQIKLKQSIL